MADTWMVTSQTQRDVLNPAGNGFDAVMDITFSVTSGPAQGTSGSVRIPVTQYDADTVRQAIDAQVSNLHEVAAL